MLKYNHNPNTFATEVPDDYQPKPFRLKDLKEFSNNVEHSANEHQGKKKKNTADIEHHIPFYEQDEYDHDASNSEFEDDDINNYEQSNPREVSTPVF